MDWRNDKPKQAGWYRASYDRDPTARRHWDGAAWSFATYEGYPSTNLDRVRRATASRTQTVWWAGAPIPQSGEVVL